jgi:hypothetical protein
MPTPTTRPTAASSLVYLALVRELPRHPALAGLVRTWHTWTGEGTADDPWSQALPGVRLTPLALPAVRHTRRSIAEPIRVLIETATRGRDFPASAELGRAIDRALFGGAGDTAASAATRRLWATVKAAGGSELVPEQVALPAAGEDLGGAMTLGHGSFLINIYIRTR